MRVRRWLLAVFVAAALVAGGSVVHDWYLSLLPRLGPLDVAPASPQVSIRIGERLRFTASAEGATGFTWLLWGRPVSFEPTWSYAPAPEEAGWQQVTVEVTGRTGLRLTRTWDVGVVAPIVPEIESLEPPAGELAATAGEKLTFRARARLPAAREGVDRLAFEWLMDERPVLREEHPADAALSELVLPAVEAGSHRLRLRVTEDGRTASLADWALDVGTTPVVAETPVPEGGVAPSTGPPSEVAAVPPVAPAPPAVVEPAPPPAVVAAPPHLVPMPGPRRLEARVGKPLVLEAPVEPASARVSYRWTVDGKRVASHGGRLEYTPRRPGRQKIEVSVEAGRQKLGRDGWSVMARAATPPTVAKLPTAPRIVRVPATAELQADAGRAVVLEARVEPSGGGVSYRWTVDGRAIRDTRTGRLAYETREGGRHTVKVTVAREGKDVGQASWVVAVRGRERPEPAVVAAPSPPVTTAPEPRRAAAALAEADVRRWLDDYAHAWSRKDLGALRRMGQVRTPAEAAQLERYFRSIDSLEVDVRILTLTVDGERASVEFERTDTVTDPSGRRQQLRLPPMRKEIERTPDGLRFAARGAAG